MIYGNARDGNNLFEGSHVNAWSYWRGGGPPRNSSRLALLRERSAFAQAKMERTVGKVAAMQQIADDVQTKLEQALLVWWQAWSAEQACAVLGPRKRDLQEAAKQAHEAVLRAKRHTAAVDGRRKNADQELDTYCECIKAARVGLAAAEWADAALASAAAAADGVQCGAMQLLEDVDDAGVPIGLALVLAAVQRDNRAWRAMPHCSPWFTVSPLSVVLGLAAVSHAYRSSVRAWVSAQLDALDFARLAQRDEFPRSESTNPGSFQQLHYDESVLSFCEPRGACDERRILASRERSRERVQAIEEQLRKPREELDFPRFHENCGMASTPSAELLATQVRLADEYFDHWRQELASELKRDACLEASVLAHAAKRATVMLPFSLRALAACHQHTARALPVRWPLRLLSALAKVAVRRPRARIDEVARAFVVVVAPGATKTQQGIYGMSGKMSAQKRREVRRSTDDGLTVANVHRVAKLLMRYSAGPGWSLAPENAFLEGDVDRDSLVSCWNADDPSVVLAANIVGRCPPRPPRATGLRAHAHPATRPLNLPRCIMRRGGLAPERLSRRGRAGWATSTARRSERTSANGTATKPASLSRRWIDAAAIARCACRCRPP